MKNIWIICRKELKSYFSSPTCKFFSAYMVVAGSALVSGDSVGLVEEIPDLLAEFRCVCHARGCNARPCTHRGDDVVAAGVADSGKGVVLAQDGHGRDLVVGPTGPGGHGGREAERAPLDGQAGVFECGGHQLGGQRLGVAPLGRPRDVLGFELMARLPSVQVSPSCAV